MIKVKLLDICDLPYSPFRKFQENVGASVYARKQFSVRRLARFVDQAFRSDASWFSNRAPLQCDTGSHHTHAAEFNFHEPVTDLRHRSHSPSADIVHKPDDMKYYNNSLQAGPPVIHIIQKVIYKLSIVSPLPVSHTGENSPPVKPAPGPVPVGQQLSTAAGAQGLCV
ncbi:hypothetical protein F2P81_014557 [Scophthalmus maximus]|uniref:Uncharacterized protein n=1 Tax=Scophthalmus maximus TaxID=52904 RepID=A0A6A4SGD3_SCOMX|nr:hypothetical protein F2P81_014557 [Scophthalmus maximus]